MKRGRHPRARHQPQSERGVGVSGSQRNNHTQKSGGCTTWSVQFGAASAVSEGNEGLGGLELTSELGEHRRCGQGMGRDTHTMNSERLHHFQISTFFIFSAKVLLQWGSMANIRFSLQPPTGGDSPREERVVSITRKARCHHDPEGTC